MSRTIFYFCQVRPDLNPSPLHKAAFFRALAIDLDLTTDSSQVLTASKIAREILFPDADPMNPKQAMSTFSPHMSLVSDPCPYALDFLETTRQTQKEFFHFICPPPNRLTEISTKPCAPPWLQCQSHLLRPEKPQRLLWC